MVQREGGNEVNSELEQAQEVVVNYTLLGSRQLDEAVATHTAGGIVPLHCMICGKQLADDYARKKGVITCPKDESDCTKIYRERRRRVIGLRRNRCRACNMPCNEEEREAFKAWRKSQGVAQRGRPRKNPKPEEATVVFDCPTHGRMSGTYCPECQMVMVPADGPAEVVRVTLGEDGNEIREVRKLGTLNPDLGFRSGRFQKETSRASFFGEGWRCEV